MKGWAVPHSEINQTKNCSLLQYNRGPIMCQVGHMLQQEIIRGWTELCYTRNQTKNKKKCPPPKFTYSGRICRFAQFFRLSTGKSGKSPGQSHQANGPNANWCSCGSHARVRFYHQVLFGKTVCWGGANLQPRKSKPQIKRSSSRSPGGGYVCRGGENLVTQK